MRSRSRSTGKTRNSTLVSVGVEVKIYQKFLRAFSLNPPYTYMDASNARQSLFIEIYAFYYSTRSRSRSSSSSPRIDSKLDVMV